MAHPETPQTAPAPQLPARGYAFGPFRLNPDSYQLSRDGTPVDLSSKVFDALVFLLSQRHRVVTKEELLASVWPDATVTDDSLVQCISMLRRALGDDATRPTYVATVARRGYRFIAPVSDFGDADASAVASGTSTLVTAASSPASVGGTSRVATASRRLKGRAILWALPAVILLLGAGWILGTTAAQRTRPAEMAGGTLRFSQQAPPGTVFSSGGALSPDARYIAFAAEEVRTGRTHLWVRALDSDSPERLEGTEGAARPFWSPDSRFIGFIANGRLKTIAVSGGTPTDVAPVGLRPAGAAWSPRGQIIFSTWLAGFSMVSASGGSITKVTDLAPGEFAHAWPQFLPDGDHFLYSAYGGGQGGVYAGRLSTGEKRLILAADAGAIYSPLGYLVYSRNGILTAQEFNPSTLELAGRPFALIAGNVQSPSMTNGTMLSASAGMLSIGGAGGESELAWFDRTGKRLEELVTPVPMHNPALSSDEKRVFANTFPPAQSGVWVVDMERGTTSRLVPDATMPVPAPDGRTLAFTATREAGAGLFTVPLDALSESNGPGFVISAERKTPVQFTNDGQSLLYYASSPRGQDLWQLHLTGNAAPTRLVDSAANEIHGRLSPDERWLAYASDESGTWEVYVQSFPEAKSRLTVSASGGAEPIWRSDGRELFYLAEDHSLMAVDVTPGPTLRLTRPTVLFRPSVVGEPATYRSHYAVTADGQRFLVDVLRDPISDPITLLLNWAHGER